MCGASARYRRKWPSPFLRLPNVCPYEAPRVDVVFGKSPVAVGRTGWPYRRRAGKLGKRVLFRPGRC